MSAFETFTPGGYSRVSRDDFTLSPVVVLVLAIRLTMAS
jgi:hypothetical protein